MKPESLQEILNDMRHAIGWRGNIIAQDRAMMIAGYRNRYSTLESLPHLDAAVDAGWMTRTAPGGRGCVYSVTDAGLKLLGVPQAKTVIE